MATFAQVRQAVQTQVETVSGYKIVPFPPQYFRRITNTISHKGFTVDMQTTNDEGERQRRGTTYVSSTCRVLFCYRLRPKDILTDYDNSMTDEQNIIAAVLQSYETVQAGIQVRYNRSTRDIPDSMDYMITTLEFTILHTL